MSSNEKEASSIALAPTLLDPSGETAVSNLPVTVVGPTLHFSGASGSARSFEENAFAERYESSSLLGEGGMGEVRLAQDARIGREVAMKVIRLAHAARDDFRARFLREVRIQGQLEHPSIVPVYDLGIGADGATYFTMKRVRGLTLAEIFDRLRVKDPLAISQFSRRKLLAAFQNVCLALEFAHARGVIHRDLKPANVMLGDFGEVYVLDWGIAKIKGDPDEHAAATPSASTTPSSADNLQTQVGALIGTLGYMSPEQFSGGEIDGRADVFSLGAILFEILTLEPLFDGTTAKVMKASAEQVDARCSVRAPDLDVPPELEAICVTATQLHLADRFQSARQLHDAIGRFLDGDRDLERRQSLASQHRELAEKEIRAIKEDPSRESAHRATALGELGRALALDPTNEIAVAEIVGLFVEPPAELPREVRDEMRQSRDALQKNISRTGAIAFSGGLLLLIPVLVSMGVKSWTSIAVIVGALLVASLLSLVQLRSPSETSSYVIMTAAAIAYCAISRVYGPLVLVPQMAMASATVYGLHSRKGIQQVSMILMSLAIMLPLLLERTGVLAPSYSFRSGEMSILPNVCELDERVTLGFLSIASVFLLLVCSMSIRRIRNALTAAEERLSVQAWQLRQLVPEQARRRLD